MNISMNTTSTSTNRGSTALWIVLILVALAAIGAAFYYYYAPAPESTTGETFATPLDETAAIEQALRQENFDDLDSELQDIERELAQ